MRVAWALLTLVIAAAPAAAQSPVRDISLSAAYWRDVCAGQRAGMSRAEQADMCGLYLSSFHDAADEYAEAGLKLFCPPETTSAETMRRDFLAYMAELPETAEFFPAGRALLQALMRAHPCPGAADAALKARR
jgi:Rap1a immunity proteins